MAKLKTKTELKITIELNKYEADIINRLLYSVINHCTTDEYSDAMTSLGGLSNDLDELIGEPKVHVHNKYLTVSDDDKE